MGGTRHVKVFFARRRVLNRPVRPDTLFIIPASDNWNDFHFRSRVELRFRANNSEEEFKTDAFLGFLDEEQDSSNGIDRLNKILERASTGMLSAEEFKFFTMLPTMEDYRKIVRTLGVDVAAEVLTAARDLVAAAELRSADWVEAAVATQIFSLSFVRDSEAYFAFKNSGPILRGLQEEELGRLSKTLQISFTLAGRQSPHDLRFEFDHTAALPRRMAILIGENGVGKSQALGRIARAAIDARPELRGEHNQRPAISRLLAFAPTNEAESVFPSDRRKRSRMRYRRFSMNRSRRSKTNEYISDLIVQVARSHQTIKERSRWEILTNTLTAIRQVEEICLPTEAFGEQGFTPVLTLNTASEQQRLLRFSSIDLRREPMRVVQGVGYPLSSGELSFLKFAAQVSLHIENGSLLLLDEPETHLHPQFISRFVWLLNRLLADTGSAAIVATHSAYFVREVFREQVTVLRIDANNLVRTEPAVLRTFGADIGAISYFVFGEDEPSALAKEVEARLRQENLDWDSLYAQYKDELSLEFLSALRAAIEQDSGNA